MSAATTTMSGETGSPSRTRAKRSGGSAVFVALGIFLSRIAGLVRVRVFAHYLGNSDAAGAFNAATRIPNFLQNLFGEGVLSASFIPVYSKLIAEGDEELARKIAGVVLSVLALGVGVIVTIGVLLTPIFVDLVAPGFHGELRELTIQLVQILFPGVGLLVLSAWCLGVLNSHRKFFISYVAPVAWNVVIIAALVLAGRSGRHTDRRGLAMAATWGYAAGCALQFGVQIPFVLKYAGRIRPSLDLKIKAVRVIFRNAGPVVLSRGVVQLSAYIDGMIASFLGAGAVSSIMYAQTIYLLPIGLFGASVAAAELPEMSSSLGAIEEIHAKLRLRLEAGKRNIAFFVIPSAVAFVLMGKQVVACLYQTGQFGRADTLYVWYILMGSTVGLLAATWGRLYSSAFYALRDTKTPLRFAIVRVLLTGALGWLFAFPLRPAILWFFGQALGLEIPALKEIDLGMGAIGLTASAGLAGWIEFICLRTALVRKIGPVRIEPSLQLRIWAAALVGAGAGLAFEYGITPRLYGALPILHSRYDFFPLFALAVFGGAYVLAAMAFRLPEARRLLKRFI